MRITRTIIGLAVVALGLILMGEQYGWWMVNFEKVWPVFVLIPGLAFLAGSSQQKRYGLLIPGVILTIYAMIFWLDLWTNYDFSGELSFLYTLAIGLAFFAVAVADPNHRPGLMRAGWILTGVSAIVLISTTGNEKLWPLVLIAAGVIMIIRPSRLIVKKPQPTSTPPAPEAEKKV